MTEFYVKIVPDADAFSIDTSGTYPEVAVTAPAEQGRANAELVERLSTVLDAEIGIMSGHRQRRKQLVVDLDRDTIMDRLRTAAES